MATFKCKVITEQGQVVKIKLKEKYNHKNIHNPAAKETRHRERQQ